MNLTRLAGNAPLKRQLELETARRGLSHAYIPVSYTHLDVYKRQDCNLRI